MTEKKMIYTVTKTSFEENDITHRYEHAFEKLYDALMFIAIWSNMKIKSGFNIIFYANDFCATNEQCYLAEKHNEDGWTIDKEEIVLRKIEFKTVNNDGES